LIQLVHRVRTPIKKDPLTVIGDRQLVALPRRTPNSHPASMSCFDLVPDRTRTALDDETITQASPGAILTIDDGASVYVRHADIGIGQVEPEPGLIVAIDLCVEIRHADGTRTLGRRLNQLSDVRLTC
jgi:hypothetical protein